MRIGKVNAAADVTPQATQQIQARGVWHRPNVTGTETDLAGICNVLDTFRKTGINLVFLETFYHGMTVFRSSMVRITRDLTNSIIPPIPIISPRLLRRRGSGALRSTHGSRTSTSG